MITIRILALALWLAGGLAAQAPESDDSIWKQYFAWFQEGDPRANTPERYRAKLMAEGLSAAQADQRLERVKQLSVRHETDLIALNFNRAYAAPVAPFNTQPNAFLVGMTAELKPGAALDVAMGQGRNAVYLATKGWKVTGFDIAEKGLESAQAAASQRGVAITTVKSRYQDFDFGEERWDLIVFSYAWVPLADATFVRRVHAALKPGGLVVIEHPAEDPLKPAAQREWAPEPTDDINTLVRVWTAGFRILRYEDTEDRCDWRNRKARVLRLLAKKW